MKPLKPKELVRTYLEEELADLWNRQLMIVAAPSGFGKTTLVHSFLQKYPEVLSIWVSFGKGEVDDVWCWTRLCEQVEMVNPEFSGKLRELGIPQTSQELEHMVWLITKNMRQKVCLVLDDFQECRGEACSRLLTSIVYEKISGLHILLISRIYPELPYEEMLLREYCSMIDQSSLALSREETEQIFLINGLHPARQEVDKIYEYTDGWISAVYLTLFDYRRTGRFGYFSGVSHLLKTAIFDKLAPVIREVLMKMSLFDDFTYEEAVFISGCSIHPMSLMEMMEQYGFMRFDYQNQRYKMHALLKTVAEAELERVQCEKALLFNRGGEWCEKNGDSVEALVNYHKAGNLDAVFRLLSGEIRSLIFESAPGVVRGIIRDTPIEIKAEYPVAWLGYIYSAILKDDLMMGRRLFEEACRAYGQMYNLDGEKRELKGELLIIKALLEFNDLEKMNASLREAYELLDRHASRIFKQSLLTFGSPLMSLLYYDKPGTLKRTIELEKEYAHYYMCLVGDGDGGWDDYFEAEYVFLTGDIERALQLLRRVEQKAILRRQTCIIISSYYLQFRCYVYLGCVEEFERKISDFTEVMKNISRPVLLMDAELAYSYSYACLGRKDRIADWLRNFDLKNCSRMVRNTRSSCTTYGMLLSKTQQWNLLDAIADLLMVSYERTVHLYAVIYGYIYKSVAAYHISGFEKALEYFHRALSLAEADEVRIPFIENSEELQPIIEGMILNHKFLNSMKPFFRQYIKSLRLFRKEREAVSLTRREEELMTLVKAGYRNSEISAKLSIAQVTVEKNLTSIYRKLNVSNRAAAIAKFEQL